MRKRLCVPLAGAPFFPTYQKAEYLKPGPLPLLMKIDEKVF